MVMAQTIWQILSHFLLLPILIPGLQAATANGPGGIIPINQGWLFGGEYSPGSEFPGHDDSGFQHVTVPHVVTPLGWKNYDNNTWNKVWIYRRYFDRPDSNDRDAVRTFLDFNGVLTVATPVINGQSLPTHEGGYLPFSYEITDFINRTNNVLALIVDARWSYVNPEGSPAGPQSVDYLEPGGISREVALRSVPSSFISDVFAKPINVLTSAPEVVVEYTIDSAKAPGQIQVLSQLIDDGKVMSQTSENNTISKSRNETSKLSIPAPHVQLWSPDSPKLYQIVTTLLIGGKPTHTFARNIGFREAIFRTDGFFLNGNRYKIFGLDRHQTFPFVGMSASERLQKRDADMLKELNCNMVRCSHYPQSPHFLDRCDELGIMVWQEVPGWQFIGNASWQQHVVSDVHDMVVRDRSRPSIILWGVQINESPREPSLYTETKALARSLDDSRQTSGTETSQSLDNWVVDVFAYDDYHSADGNAYLLPPLTTVPYLITESVGALDGPRFYRWIDDHHVPHDQATLHAQVHDIAGGNNSYAGLIAWCGFDYDSLNGNIYQNIKWPGVVDTFRVYKPGAAFYLTQGSPIKRAIIEPAFYWDFGLTSPVTTLAQNATIWSNCDRLEVYINGAHFATLEPDHANFPHTAHPPFYLDTTKIKGSDSPELRLDGYVSGKKLTSRTYSGSTNGDRIKISLNDQELIADGIDSTLISFRVVDKYGNPRPYGTGDVEVIISGPGQWVNALVALDVTAKPLVISAGQSSQVTTVLKNGVFPLSENGGVGGALIRTIAGHAGTILVQVVHPTLGRDGVQIKALSSPGSQVASPINSSDLSNIELSIMSTANWTVKPAGTNTGATSWTVSPKVANAWLQPPAINASFSIAGQSAQASVNVPVYSSLTLEQARNNVGISNDSEVSIGNFDGLNNSYSTQALAAVELKPGGKFRVGAVTFTWPNVPAGTPDNILSLGQTILVNGTGNTLGFVGASTQTFNGGIGTIFYTDGSASSFTLELGNYLDTRYLGNGVVATTPYINNATGQDHGHTGTIFYSLTTLVANKTAFAVNLPTTASITSTNVTAALHIFCIATG